MERKMGSGDVSFKKIRGTNPFGNQLKLFWHMDRLYQFLQNGSTFPIQVELNPTNQCNMACRWCITEYAHRNDSIPIDTLKNFLNEFVSLGGKSIDWTGGGEPSCYTHINEAIHYASSVGLKQGMMTNGLFTESLIDTLSKALTWIRFSLDTVDPDIHSEMKGIGKNALSVILHNINKFGEYSPRPRVVVNINVAEWNGNSIESTIETARDLGADGVQIRPILPPIGEHLSNETINFYSQFIQKFSDLKKLETPKFQLFISHDKFYDIIENRLYERPYTRCQYHQFIVVLNANGDLCVCTHHLYNNQFTFGNICNNTISEIWNSPKRREVIAFCNNSLDFSTCQVCCKGHELNKLLHFIQNPEPKSDPDFF